MDALRAKGSRVGLRAVREDDLPLIERLRAAGREAETLVITYADADSPLGVIQYRMDEPSEGWATIDHLAVAEESRRWGLGQDAVRLLEETIAASRRIEHFKTAIDVRQGLALYLWLRLGYRPLGIGRTRSGEDAVEMVRDAA